jgi:hypothetical protein
VLPCEDIWHFQPCFTESIIEYIQKGGRSRVLEGSKLLSQYSSFKSPQIVFSAILGLNQEELRPGLGQVGLANIIPNPKVSER